MIGAFFLDQGYDACSAAVLPWFEEKIQHAASEISLKDPKSRLQEALQARHACLPTYEVIEVTGKSHDQYFRVRCSVENFDFSTEGEGTSRRRAEQIAAERYLEKLIQHGS